MYKLFFYVFCSTLVFAQNTQITAEKFQENLNISFSDSLKSPLTSEDFKNFKGLYFFPIQEKFKVKAQFIRTKKEKKFGMKTTTDRLPQYKKYGELLFEIDTIPLKLNVYQNLDLIKKEGYEKYLFLPFYDQNSGKETYIGGRYLDLQIQDGNVWLLDFNKAYNPYCAYNQKYSCPIVPQENELKIAINAGVKKFHD